MFWSDLSICNVKKIGFLLVWYGKSSMTQKFFLNISFIGNNRSYEVRQVDNWMEIDVDQSNLLFHHIVM